MTIKEEKWYHNTIKEKRRAMMLIRFSEGLSIALHGLAYLATRKGEKISGKEIAKKIDAAENTLHKIFQRLVRAGIVFSQRGPSGGFYLEDLNIDFLTVYKILEGDGEKLNCPLGKTSCPFKDCILGEDFKKIENDLKNLLKSKRLSDLKGRE